MRATRWLALLLAVLVPSAFLALVAPRSDAESKVKALIVTGFDAGAHKWRETTDLTRAILEKTGRFEVKVCEDLGIFESSSLEGYDVVILNYGFWEAPEPSGRSKEGLLAYVKKGKGLVAVHFSCSSFQEWGEYGELLGRTWKKGVGGHGPRGKFKVSIKAADHPITKGLSDFETDDELYAKLSGEAEIDVLASAHSEWSGKEEPIVFVKKYGAGRVVHNVLGHDARARENESFAKLLARGAEWAARGTVGAE
jgi:type 1 glutamine amidotransferase